jgi:protein O-GlcNAc transferase
LSDPSIQVATQHHQAGRLAEAEKIYRQILARQPEDAEALYLLAIITGQKGQMESAVDMTRRAIRANPNLAEAHHSLGVLLQQMGKAAESIAPLRTAMEMKPDYARAHHNLGVGLQALGRHEEAIAALRQAVRIMPGYVKANYNLSTSLEALGRYEEAIEALKQVIRLTPKDADALYSLGWCYGKEGKFDEAATWYRRAISVRPNFPAALTNLGIALHTKGQVAQFVDADFREGMAAFREVARLRPDSASAWANLGSALMKIGEHDEAMRAYEKSIRLDPNIPSTHSAMIYAAQFHPGFDAAKLLAAARRYAELVERPLAGKIAPHANDRTKKRRLKVGYVSPDFCHHPIARFLLPLLQNHDPREVEIFCYSGVTRPDETTHRFKGIGTYIEVARLPDDQLAQRIRADGIDILVDLSLHMIGNRLATFARKPAPVQVTWLGYVGTTGLRTMDYRLTDAILDPPGEGDANYSEKSVRLPHTYWCYEPYTEEIDVGPLPAAERGLVTFGCFNGYLKVTSGMLELWATLLAELPKSRLVIHSPPDKHLERVLERFSRGGVAAGRIEFVGKKSIREYLLGYQGIDIALDPSPYGGGTTTCDALWMGVPTVTLRGRTAVGRGSASILSNVALGDWIAENADQYLAIATQKARDVAALAELRAKLRERMRQSALMNGKQFAADVEAAYRGMWEDWAGR